LAGEGGEGHKTKGEIKKTFSESVGGKGLEGIRGVFAKAAQENCATMPKPDFTGMAKPKRKDCHSRGCRGFTHENGKGSPEAGGRKVKRQDIKS